MKANQEQLKHKSKQVTVENILGDDHYELDFDVTYAILLVPANPLADNDIDYFGTTEIDITTIEWEGTEIEDCVEEVGVELFMSTKTIYEKVEEIINKEEGV